MTELKDELIFHPDGWCIRASKLGELALWMQTTWGIPYNVLWNEIYRIFEVERESI